MSFIQAMSHRTNAADAQNAAKTAINVNSPTITFNAIRHLHN